MKQHWHHQHDSGGECTCLCPLDDGGMMRVALGTADRLNATLSKEPPTDWPNPVMWAAFSGCSPIRRYPGDLR